MGIEQEGSLSFRIRHEDKDWATNAKPYEFPRVQGGKISAWVVKHPTGRIEIHVVGPLNSEMMFDGVLPPVREEGLSITVTWSPQQIQLFLDGRPFKTVRMHEGKPNGGAGGGKAGPPPT